MENYLFADPGLISSIGRVLDLGATMLEFNYVSTPEMADELAMRSDWCHVGDDIHTAMDRHRDETKND